MDCYNRLDEILLEKVMLRTTGTLNFLIHSSMPKTQHCFAFCPACLAIAPLTQLGTMDSILYEEPRPD